MSPGKLGITSVCDKSGVVMITSHFRLLSTAWKKGSVANKGRVGIGASKEYQDRHYIFFKDVPLGGKTLY